MSSFLSHLHADIRRTKLTRRGATHRPEDVPRGMFKEYPRMERIFLPEPVRLDVSFQQTLERRHSTMSSQTGVSLALNDLGTLMGSALRRHKNDSRRQYPSGGGLYPIETYLLITEIEGANPGVFHYHPGAHALERLWDLPSNFDMKRIVYKPDTLHPSTLVVFTSVWERSSAKYGDLSYQHALLEAGHMSQNILLAATALNLDARPYAGFDDEMIIHMLDLDDAFEQPVHTVTISKILNGEDTSNNRMVEV